MQKSKTKNTSLLMPSLQQLKLKEEDLAPGIKAAATFGPAFCLAPLKGQTIDLMNLMDYYIMVR